MNNQNEFESILNHCLEKMLHGETIESCLQRYPQHKEQLEPLLKTAISAKSLLEVRPRPEFKSKARSEFLSAVSSIQAAKKSRQPLAFLPWNWHWQPGWAITVVTVLVILVAGGSTVVAAGNSQPDSALYPVKLATEQVQMALIFSDVKKAELRVSLAEKRVQEIVYAASKGDTDQVQTVALNLNHNLRNLNDFITDKYPVKSDATSRSTAPTDVAPGKLSTSSAGGKAQAPTAAPAPMLAQPAAAPPAGTPTALATKAQVESRDTQEGRSASSSTQENTTASNLSGAPKTNGDLEKMKQSISGNSAIQEAQLDAALEKASPNVRPALRQAIAQSKAEYEKALKALNQAQTGKP